MGLARALAVALSGMHGELVEVECDISSGLPGLAFTGRADTSVQESRDRIRAAVHNSGVRWPQVKVTVALLPADVRKVGSRFDLAICMAVLAAGGQVPPATVADVAWIAELGLDGALRPVRGVLPSVVSARARGVRRIVVARGNAAEAALVGDLDIRAADSLADIVQWLTGEGPALCDAVRAGSPPRPEQGPDLADVAGQAIGKRALEIAAAGAHHLYLLGTPGAGKTMLAERMPGLLPPLDESESLEVTAVQSVAGLLGEHAHLVSQPPIQAPHHTASVAAIVGGGSFLARPGAISLAHHGVLFLDEGPEFARHVLDALREPLETGHVVLHRAGGAVRYPARFQLILAANPCPCGTRDNECVCTPNVRRQYLRKLSGPLMDRIDLHVDIAPVAHTELFEFAEDRETTPVVAARVAAARAAAAARWRSLGWATNSAVPGGVLRAAPWLPSPEVIRPARDHLASGTLTARGFDRVLRLAWTLADLAGRVCPAATDVSEALFFRTGSAEATAA